MTSPDLNSDGSEAIDAVAEASPWNLSPRGSLASREVVRKEVAMEIRRN